MESIEITFPITNSPETKDPCLVCNKREHNIFLQKGGESGFPLGLKAFSDL